MKKSLAFCLCCALALPLNVSAYSGYGDENPFVEAMLRMMEIFGLIPRDRWSQSIPYLPGYGGLGGFPGASPMTGFGGIPGMSPMSGFGGVPGMSPMTGFGGVPGMGFPGAGGIPGNWANPGSPGQGRSNHVSTHLDGAWELQNGSFVIIQGDAARLYLSREQYQDFAVYYDQQYLWWQPQEGGAPSRYLYQTQEGRMILRDEEGQQLLLRRRR